MPLSDTYADRLCRALTEELYEGITGTINRCIGLAANLEFWIDEIEHVLNVLNGSQERLERAARYREFCANGDVPQAYETIKWEDYVRHRDLRQRDLEKLRAEILSTTERFLQRCVNEKLINKTTRRAALRRLKIKA